MGYPQTGPQTPQTENANSICGQILCLRKEARVFFVFCTEYSDKKREKKKNSARAFASRWRVPRQHQFSGGRAQLTSRPVSSDVTSSLPRAGNLWCCAVIARRVVLVAPRAGASVPVSISSAARQTTLRLPQVTVPSCPAGWALDQSGPRAVLPREARASVALVRETRARFPSRWCCFSFLRRPSDSCSLAPSLRGAPRCPC